MRCETWMRVVLLSVATFGSGGMLAAEAAVGAPVLDAAKAQAQPAKRAPIKRAKKKNVQAATVLDHSPTMPGQGDAATPTLPAHIEEDIPADNSAQPLALKGVRG